MNTIPLASSTNHWRTPNLKPSHEVTTCTLNHQACFRKANNAYCPSTSLKAAPRGRTRSGDACTLHFPCLRWHIKGPHDYIGTSRAHMLTLGHQGLHAYVGTSRAHMLTLAHQGLRAYVGTSRAHTLTLTH
eukprot:1016313-Pelagomonas_calceolata.AAC.4